MSTPPFDRLQVFQVAESEVYWRLLWTDEVDGRSVRHVVISITGAPLLPKWITAEELSRRIEQREWRPIERNPYPFAYRVDAELDGISLRARERYLGIKRQKVEAISPIVALKRDAFVSTTREASIRAICTPDSLLAPSTMRLWLVEFWRSGEDPACFFPRFSQRGRRSYAELFKREPKNAITSSEPVSKGTKPIARTGPRRKHADTNGAWGCDLTLHDWQRLKLGAKEFLFVPGRHFKRGRRLPFTAAHRSTLAKYFTAKVATECDASGNKLKVISERPSTEWPSIEQFMTACWSDQEIAEVIKQVEGERAYLSSYRTISGSSLDIAEGPGAVYQVDWMLAKIWLVNRIDRTLCGRPYVYFVTDTFSRMITGIYVTFERPSYRTAAMALLEAMSDKVTFAARYRVSLAPTDWPCQHIPDLILHDGGEIASRLSDYVPYHVADLATAPPYRAELKSIVEKRFGLSGIGCIEWLVGAAVKDLPKDAPNPKEKAMLSIEDFTAQLIRWCVFEHNQKWVRRMDRTAEGLIEGIDPVPLTLWNWAIKRCWARLPRLPRAELLPKLLPRESARVTKRGLEFRTLRYYLRECVALTDLMHRASLRDEQIEVQVAFDANHTDQIHLVTPGKRSTFETIPLVQRGYAGRTFKELESHRDDEKERSLSLQAETGVRGVREEKLRQEAAQGAANKKAAAAIVIAIGNSDPVVARRAEIELHRAEERTCNALVSVPPPATSNVPPTIPARMSRVARLARASQTQALRP